MGIAFLGACANVSTLASSDAHHNQMANAYTEVVPPGIYWTRTGGRTWQVVIRREPERVDCCPHLGLREWTAPAPSACASELRPALEHADKPLHWVRQIGLTEPDVAEWINETWEFLGEADALSPAEAAACGYRYLGPAEWHDQATGRHERRSYTCPPQGLGVVCGAGR